MSRPSAEWFYQVPEDKRPQFESNLRICSPLGYQLLRLCDKWEQELNSAESKISDYDTPCWDVKQAHRNGDRARIRKLRDLLSFFNEKD